MKLKIDTESDYQFNHYDSFIKKELINGFKRNTR
jgi:hypothetical protein